MEKQHVADRFLSAALRELDVLPEHIALLRVRDHIESARIALAKDGIDAALAEAAERLDPQR